LLLENIGHNETFTISRRRVERASLSITVRVDRQESKNVLSSEITRFQTLSSFGADFILSQKVEVGQLLLLTASFPSDVKGFDYQIWTLVRHCQAVKSSGRAKEHFLVGVAFVGKYPPINHRQNPDKRYVLSNFNKDGFCEISEMSSDVTASFSEENYEVSPRDNRYPIPFEIFVEVLDEKQNPVEYEFTVTENINQKGSAVKTFLDAEIGNYLKIGLVEGNFSILAIVRHRRIGDDGIPRLHLEFLNQKFPLEGIE